MALRRSHTTAVVATRMPTDRVRQLRAIAARFGVTVSDLVADSLERTYGVGGGVNVGAADRLTGAVSVPPPGSPRVAEDA